MVMALMALVKEYIKFTIAWDILRLTDLRRFSHILRETYVGYLHVVFSVTIVRSCLCWDIHCLPGNRAAL